MNICRKVFNINESPSSYASLFDILTEYESSADACGNRVGNGRSTSQTGSLSVKCDYRGSTPLTKIRKKKDQSSIGDLVRSKFHLLQIFDQKNWKYRDFSGGKSWLWQETYYLLTMIYSRLEGFRAEQS